MEHLNEDLKKAGVSEQQLQTEVELLLRKYDIPISKPETKSDLTLYIDVQGAEVKETGGHGTGKYYFFVGVRATQTVRLSRDTSVMVVTAVTWEVVGGLGYIPKGSMPNLKVTIADVVKDQTKEFINAYLEANPK